MTGIGPLRQHCRTAATANVAWRESTMAPRPPGSSQGMGAGSQNVLGFDGSSCVGLHRQCDGKRQLNRMLVVADTVVKNPWVSGHVEEWRALKNRDQVMGQIFAGGLPDAPTLGGQGHWASNQYGLGALLGLQGGPVCGGNVVDAVQGGARLVTFTHTRGAAWTAMVGVWLWRFFCSGMLRGDWTRSHRVSLQCRDDGSGLAAGHRLQDVRRWYNSCWRPYFGRSPLEPARLDALGRLGEGESISHTFERRGVFAGSCLPITGGLGGTYARGSSLTLAVARPLAAPDSFEVEVVRTYEPSRSAFVGAPGLCAVDRAAVWPERHVWRYRFGRDQQAACEAFLRHLAPSGQPCDALWQDADALDLTLRAQAGEPTLQIRPTQVVGTANEIGTFLPMGNMLRRHVLPSYQEVSLGRATRDVAVDAWLSEAGRKQQVHAIVKQDTVRLGPEGLLRRNLDVTHWLQSADRPARLEAEAEIALSAATADDFAAYAYAELEAIAPHLSGVLCPPDAAPLARTHRALKMTLRLDHQRLAELVGQTLPPWLTPQASTSLAAALAQPPESLASAVQQALAAHGVPALLALAHCLRPAECLVIEPRVDAVAQALNESDEVLRAHSTPLTAAIAPNALVARVDAVQSALRLVDAALQDGVHGARAGAASAVLKERADALRACVTPHADEGQAVRARWRQRRRSFVASAADDWFDACADGAPAAIERAVAALRTSGPCLARQAPSLRRQLRALHRRMLGDVLASDTHRADYDEKIRTCLAELTGV